MQKQSMQGSSELGEKVDDSINSCWLMVDDSINRANVYITAGVACWLAVLEFAAIAAALVAAHGLGTVSRAPVGKKYD